MRCPAVRWCRLQVLQGMRWQPRGPRRQRRRRSRRSGSRARTRSEHNLVSLGAFNLNNLMSKFEISNWDCNSKLPIGIGIGRTRPRAYTLTFMIKRRYSFSVVLEDNVSYTYRTRIRILPCTLSLCVFLLICHQSISLHFDESCNWVRGRSTYARSTISGHAKWAYA